MSSASSPAAGSAGGNGGSVSLRRMRPDDIAAAKACTDAAFAPIRVQPPGAPKFPPEAARVRYGHLRNTDPDGAWVAELEGVVRGVALAFRRERAGGQAMWGLSLLSVHPDSQGAGLGHALLDAALGYAHPDDVRLVASTADPQAIRRYARSGFLLHPSLKATGPVLDEGLSSPSSVRDGGPADFEFADAVDVDVRGFPHGPDHAALLAAGHDLLVHDDGYAYARRGRVALVAATGEDAASALLRAALVSASRSDTRVVEVHWIRAGMDWAVDVCLAAGLSVAPSGPVCTRDVQMPTTYLQDGTYL